MKKALTVLFTVLITSVSFAQNENVFLKRGFWKENPTVQSIQSKIKEGNNPSEANSNNFDAVVYAILENAPNESIAYLIEQKGNGVNKLTHDGRTYIFWAAYKGNDQLMEYLIEKGAKTDITDDKGSTIINFAAGSGQQNTKVYDLILQQGADLQKDLSPNGANALLLASTSDVDFKLIKYFQSKGLDISSTDANGNGVFNYVARSGNKETLNALLKKGVKGTDKAFIFAAYGTRRQPNDLSFYEYLDSKGLNPNVKNSEGQTPLHILAYRSDDTDIINFLLGKDLDVNQQDDNGNTPFINAASRNGLNIVGFLFKNLKDINQTNNKEQSALTMAVSNNDSDVVEFLLENKANTDIIDDKGNNLTYYLAESYSTRSKGEFFKKMELLKNYGVNVENLKNSGNTWYHIAVQKNNIELLELVTKMNQDINAKNEEGNTALHLAAMKAKDDTVLKFLLKNGAKSEVETDFEETAYDLAKENELLQKNNISIEFLK